MNNFLIFLKKHPILIQIIISFLLLLIIPLVFFRFYFVNNVLKEFNNEIENSYTYKLEQVSKFLNSEFEKFQISAFEIANNPNLKSYIIKMNEPNKMNAVKILNDHKNYTMYNEYTLKTNDMALYYKDDNDVYSSFGLYNLDRYFKEILKISDNEQLIENIKKCEKPFIYAQDSSNVTQRTILYIQPIYTEKLYKYDGVVIVSIPFEDITYKIANTVGNWECQFYIYNDIIKKPIYLSSKEDNIPLAQNSEILSFLAQKNNMKNLKNDCVLLKKEISYPPLTYVSVSKTSEFFKKGNLLMKNMSLIFILVFILGILLIIALSGINYRPISKLLKNIKNQNKNINPNKFINELDYINEFLQIQVLNSEELNKQLLEQEIHLKSQTVAAIILGTHLSQTDDKVCKLLNLQGPKYCIALIYVKEINENKISDLIVNIENNLEFNGNVTELYNYDCIALILNLDSDQPSQRYELINTLHLAPNLKIGIGNVCDDIKYLKSSYLEALSALEYITKHSENNIVLFENIVNIYSAFDWYPTKNFLLLLQSLRCGDIEDSSLKIDEIFSEIKEKNISQIMGQYICYDMINNFIKFIKESNVNINLDIINKLATFSDFDNMQEIFHIISIDICKEIRISNNSKQYLLIDDIKDFINENCFDYDMSLDKLAEKFSISPYTLSKIFKKHTGYGFKEYLVEMRIKKSKDMLKNSSKSIKEIAEIVGYSDPSYYIRIFKSYEGMTPNQYRRNEMN